jgi:hypothetical protein
MFLENPMEDRVRFIAHSGKKILLIDFSHGSCEELLQALTRVQATVAAQPPDSVLILADFADAEIDKDVASRMKQVLVFDRPFVRRSAWIGTESLPKVFYENFKSFSRRDFPIFKTREEALEWLVKDD